ncbi:SET and MYND domain-containing protein 4-like [Amphibalanus amphitrite]|uniref:SET and MYND domain-containing protein 4-like n=1 Tax=Amphibalanus amphitrite TaxID=1232801 RepID=UPI001C8FF93B|nr:SET and MYND domain-containing protein 4-like [Amphibalanus amphitrite]
MPLERPELDEERAGFFRPFSQSVMRSLSADQWTGFCALSSDEQRVAFVYELPEVRQVALQHVYKEKDETEARARKDEGNKLFSEGNYPAAMRCYSQAMAKAPYKDGVSELVAVCAANRSACLYHTGKHQRCLADIELALLSGYPTALRYKVLDRRARSLMALRRFTEAKTAFQSVIKALDDASLGDGKQMHWQKEVQKMLALFEKSKYTDADPQPHSWLPPLPSLTAGANQMYPAASKKVAVRETAEEGRFAVSAQPVAVGDVLVVEKPFAAVLRPEKYGTHCLHCHVRIRDCVPCTVCSGVLFCSLPCREAALGSYHRVECRIQELLYASGMSVTCLLSLRLTTRLSVQQLLAARPRLSQPPAGPYSGQDYGAVYRLVAHTDRRTPETLFPLTLMAVFMLRCLQFQGYFGDEVDTAVLDDRRRFVGGLLLHHIQLVPYNAHEVAELRMKGHNNLDGSESVFVGAAVYPTLALFNHSCDPGIVRYFSGNNVIARAIKNIEKGDLIAENYGPIFTQKPLRERLQYLRERYEFECHCTPCTEMWPTFEEMDNSVLKFKCTTCKRPLPVSTETMTPLFTCQHCGHETNIMKALKVLQDTDAAYRAGMRDLETGELTRGMQTLMSNLSRLDQCLYPPYRDYHLCQQAIRKVMLTQGNKFIAENKP